MRLQPASPCSRNIKTLGSDWFTYDGVNRLTVGTASAGAVRQCTSYNAFGALTGLGSGTTTCTPSSISVDAATNRMASPVTYDAAGSMTAWGVNTYSWTRDDQMLTTTGTGINRSYAYTSDGERVLDRNNLDSTRTLWIRDLSGKVLREYGRSGAGVWSWSKDYVYREGLPVATVQPPKAGGSPLVKHLHLDHLGTVRRITDTQATPQLIASASRDYYPFGLEATTTADTERLRFTGHQRDTQGTTAQADDLDYMHARYYNPTVGRFLSVDPVRGNPKTPQSWNLYAYVQNNPVNRIDPDGKMMMNAAILAVVQTDKQGNTKVVQTEAQRRLVAAATMYSPVPLIATTTTGVVARTTAPVVRNAAGEIIKNPWNAFQALMAGKGFRATEVRQAYQAARQFGVWPSQQAASEVRVVTDEAMGMAAIEAGAQRGQAVLNAGDTVIDKVALGAAVVFQKVKDLLSGIFK